LEKPPGTRPGGNGVGSFVDVGLKHPVLIDHALKPGVRVTVRIDTYDRKSRKCEPRTMKRRHLVARFVFSLLLSSAAVLLGSAVPPSRPREEDGSYWGYTVRLASSLRGVFGGSSFEVTFV
jgi:hypothetical protein